MLDMITKEKLGQNLQKRARELGLSDAEVARRLGLGQSRYANYISGTREPDFGTFVKICQVLEATPDQLLDFAPWPQIGSEEQALVQRIQAVTKVLNTTSLKTAAMVLDCLATTQDSNQEAGGC